MILKQNYRKFKFNLTLFVFCLGFIFTFSPKAAFAAAPVEMSFRYNLSQERKTQLANDLYQIINDIQKQVPTGKKLVLSKYVVGTDKYIVDECGGGAIACYDRRGIIFIGQYAIEDKTLYKETVAHELNHAFNKWGNNIVWEEYFAERYGQEYVGNKYEGFEKFDPALNQLLITIGKDDPEVFLKNVFYGWGDFNLFNFVAKQLKKNNCMPSGDFEREIVSRWVLYADKDHPKNGDKAATEYIQSLEKCYKGSVTPTTSPTLPPIILPTKTPTLTPDPAITLTPELDPDPAITLTPELDPGPAITLTPVIDPTVTADGRDIIITAPSVIKNGQRVSIKMQFMNLKGYSYQLWIATTDYGNCKNLEAGKCFWSKSTGIINFDDQTFEHFWDTKAAGTTVGNKLVRVKVFKEMGNDNSLFCKQEGSIRVQAGDVTSGQSNIVNAGISCNDSTGSVTLTQDGSDVIVNFEEFYNVYSPANFVILRNSQQIGSTTTNSFIDKNVPNGVYKYEVQVKYENSQKEAFLRSLFPKAHAALSPPVRTGSISVGPSTQSSVQPSAGGPAQTDIGSASNIGEFATLLFTWGIPVIGSLAVLMFIFAGYLYMTSQGNQENITKAKDIVFGVIIGLLLLFTVEVILKTIIGTI